MRVFATVDDRQAKIRKMAIDHLAAEGQLQEQLGVVRGILVGGVPIPEGQREPLKTDSIQALREMLDDPAAPEEIVSEDYPIGTIIRGLLATVEDRDRKLAAIEAAVLLEDGRETS
jgi:hypothetical protein